MLQYITNSNCPHSVVDQVKAVLEAGCKWIQISMKNASDEEITKVVDEIKPMCAEKDAFIVLDGHVELAKRIEASGVHLGKTDMLPSKARLELGPSAIIGVTVNTFDDILGVKSLDIDYVRLEPFSESNNAESTSPTLDLESVMNICRMMNDNEITIAKVVGKGIKLENVEALMKTGINCIAVSSAIANAENPTLEARRFLDKLTPFEPKTSDAISPVE